MILTLRSILTELLKAAEADGVNIRIVSKYGFQMPPVLESLDEQGDVWTTTRFSSLGATVSKIGTTFSDEYIESRKALGYEKYISPDRQIDASTCVFPEYTWFLKNAIHDDWTKEEDWLITTSCDSDERITVRDMDGRSQFMVYDRETDTVTPMTEDNSKTKTYETESKPKNKLLSALTALFKWFKTLNDYLRQIFKKK